MWGGTPTRMRSNAVGGGNSYFMLGVGGCNYDASTVQYFTGSLFVTTYASATTVHLIRNYVALCVIVLHLKFVKD